MVTQVKQADGSIGYVDGPDATKNSLNVAKLDVGQGPVALSADSVARRAVRGHGQRVWGRRQVTLNYGLKEKGAYPALLVTYEVHLHKGLSGRPGEVRQLPS